MEKMGEVESVVDELVLVLNPGGVIKKRGPSSGASLIEFNLIYRIRSILRAAMNSFI